VAKKCSRSPVIRKWSKDKKEFPGYGSEAHCKKNPIYVFPEMNCAASFSISTPMYVRAIYVFPQSVNLFSCSNIGRPILGIYKSLTDT
jgi:hypothetical protein